MPPRKAPETPDTLVDHESLPEALLAIQAAMPAFQRDSLNPYHDSKYLSLETLLPQVLDVLNKHGVLLTQFPTSVNGVGALRTRFMHVKSGQVDEDTMLLMPTKENPQGQGSAISYAKRYAIQAALGITADKDDDGNAAMQWNQPAQDAQVVSTTIVPQPAQDVSVFGSSGAL